MFDVRRWVRRSSAFRPLPKKSCSSPLTEAQSLIRTFVKILVHATWIIVTAAALAGTPTLGNYPDTSLPLSTNTAVAPDSPPTNTTSVTVSTSTNFNGTLAGDPITGVVRVTDSRPAG